MVIRHDEAALGVMKQSALLEFEPTAFAVEPGEDELAKSWCVPTGEVIAEDFGWCIPIESKPHRLYVACASAQEAPNTWRVFVFAEGDRPVVSPARQGSKRSVGRFALWLRQAGLGRCTSGAHLA